jgi:AcrR family transcriptional regulator
MAKSVRAATGSAKTAPKSRKEQALETRANLKEATKTVLGRIGYRQMRIADVTKEAGVAVGLFYHYFPDLKAVTCEVLSDFMGEMTEQARQVPSTSDFFETLREQYKILIGHFEQHPGLMRCMIQASDEIPEFGEIWKAANRQWTRSFARYLADCLGLAQPDPDTTMLMAYCLGSMSDGVMHEYYVQQNPDLVSRIRSKDELAEILATLTYRAVFLANPPTEKLSLTRPMATLATPVDGGRRRSGSANRPPAG